MDTEDIKKWVSEFIFYSLIFGAIILIVPNITNELWRNAHAAELAIALLLLAILLNTRGSDVQI